MKSLVDKYIKEDKRDELLELAFKQQNNIDLKAVADYYIKVRDSFNLCELISMVSEYLDLDYVFGKIIKTNDKKFIFWIYNNNIIKNIINEKYFKYLEESLMN